MNCPVCQSIVKETSVFYRNDEAFLSVAWLPKTPLTNSGYGLIHLVKCECCDYVFNSAFDAKKSENLYMQDNYIVKLTASPRMSQALEEVFEFLKPHITTHRILEVAPGNGALAFALSKISDQVITIDPAPSAEASIKGLDAENIKHIRDFFSAESVESFCEEPFDLVVARHLIEHLPQPKGFLEDVFKALADDGSVYIECPNFNEIALSGRYYDIFHDHFGYFNRFSFEELCRTSGFKVVRSISLFKGQHMGFLLKKNLSAVVSPDRERGSEQLKLEALSLNRDRNNSMLNSERGEVAIWGAGAHGNAFINELEKNLRNKIVCCFDKDPSKTGRFLQDSPAEIIPPSFEKVSSFKMIIVAASLYEEDIVSEIRNMGFKGEIVKTAYMSETKNY